MDLRLKSISAEQGEAVGVLEGAYIMHEEYSPYKPLMVETPPTPLSSNVATNTSRPDFGLGLRQSRPDFGLGRF